MLGRILERGRKAEPDTIALEADAGLGQRMTCFGEAAGLRAGPVAEIVLSSDADDVERRSEWARQAGAALEEELVTPASRPSRVEPRPGGRRLRKSIVALRPNREGRNRFLQDYVNKFIQNRQDENDTIVKL